MIPTVACRSFGGAHGFAWKPKTDKLTGAYIADKEYWLPSRDDRRLRVLAMNWDSAINPIRRDKFIEEAISKGCDAFVGTMSTRPGASVDKLDWLSYLMLQQYRGLPCPYTIQNMEIGFNNNFMLALPCLADKRGDEGIPGIVPYVLASDGSSGTEGALLKMLMTASSYTPPAVLSEIIMLKLYPAYLRAILANCWWAGLGITNPYCHQSAYDTKEGTTTDILLRPERMRAFCESRTAPPEVCKIQLIDPKLPTYSVVTPSFVGGILPKGTVMKYENIIYADGLRRIDLSEENSFHPYGYPQWSPTSSRSEFAVVREGAMPAYISFWNEGVMP